MSYWLHLGTFGFSWVYVGSCGFLWVGGFPWGFLRFLRFYEVLKDILSHFGYIWVHMGTQGFSWISVGPMGLVGSPWLFGFLGFFRF